MSHSHESRLSMRFIATCIIVLAVGCSRQNTTEEFDAIYAQRAQWVRSRSVTALLADMSPDYSIRLANGQTMSREQVEERWKFYYDKVLVRHIRFANVVQGLKHHGDSVTVTVEQQDHRLQNGPNGKQMEVEANVLHDETWIRRPEGWKLQMTMEGKQTKLLIDGKPPVP
jgi:hypothetical protein